MKIGDRLLNKAILTLPLENMKRQVAEYLNMDCESILPSLKCLSR